MDPETGKVPGPPTSRHLHRIERGLLALGFVTLGLFGLSHLWADVYQLLEESRLSWAMQRAGSDGGSATAAGELPVGRIEIKRLGMSAIIADGIDVGTLLVAAGHVPGTALPGEPGNVVLGGHRDTFFRRLRDIRRHDTVSITTPGGTFNYRVDSTSVITPDQTDVLAPTDVPTLTLITCYPFNFIGPAPKRFVVRARQVDPASERAGNTLPHERSLSSNQ